MKTGTRFQVSGVKGRKRKAPPLIALVALAICGQVGVWSDEPAISELTLAGLRPGRDKLARAVALYGKRYTQAYANTPDLLLWADSRKRLFLRLELREDKTIEAVTVASFGPNVAPVTTLPATVAASGRGLRLGAPLEKALRLFGPPYFQGPSSEGERELILVVHKFKAEEDQPQILETSYDPQTRKLVKMTLSFPYY